MLLFLIGTLEIDIFQEHEMFTAEQNKYQLLLPLLSLKVQYS